jgi:hypothetical protein
MGALLARRRRTPPEPRSDKPRRLEYGRDPSLLDTSPGRGDDLELWAVRDALVALDLPGLLPTVLRETFDQIYDGQRTGRWDAEQLGKTEKTHIGTLIQINLQKELELADGEDLDYRIAGVEVDCKWSRLMYGWEIPPEMYRKQPHIALALWGNDYTSRWAAGLIRITEDVLRPMGRQRDAKRRLNEAGRSSVVWLGDGDLVANTLLDLPAGQRRRILGQRSGQQAVNSLFRELPAVLVNRATVLTAAQQNDCLKRVRDARKALKTEGVVIFGHYAPHPALAEALGLPRPTLGRFVSARLAPAERTAPDLSIELQGRRWRLATADDPITMAPTLPAQGREAE